LDTQMPSVIPDLCGHGADQPKSRRVGDAHDGLIPLA
jgi:hypothetical protein